MSKEELNNCLKYFYTSARKQDGSYYKGASLKAIRAALDRYLRSPPHSKQFSIVSDAAFTEANRVLFSFVKHLKMTGKIEGAVHRQAITKEQVEKLYNSGQLGPANSQDPAQLQRTAWFYLGLYFGRQGMENQCDLKTEMLLLRKTPQGEEYFELNRPMPSPLSAITDAQNRSNAKVMFSVVGSPRCPVQTIKNYLSHLNPTSDVIFQRPRVKFWPKDAIWYGPSPLGSHTLDKFMREMSKRAGIKPHITKHCLKITAVSLLSRRNCTTSYTVHTETPSATDDQIVKSQYFLPSLEHQQHTSFLHRNFLANEVHGATIMAPESEVIATMIEIEQQQNTAGEIAFQVRKIPIMAQQPNQIAVSSSSNTINAAHGGQLNPLPLLLEKPPCMETAKNHKFNWRML